MVHTSRMHAVFFFFFFNLRHVKLVFSFVYSFYFWLHWVVNASVWVFYSCGWVETVLHCNAQAPQWSGFPSCGAQALGEWAQ